MVNPGPARVPSLPVPLLRDAVARQVARASLRSAAREMGISPNGLRNFLNGATPRARTRAKLERWLGKRSARAPKPNVGHLVRLIGEIGADLSPAEVAALARQIAALLEAAYESRRIPPPSWVRELAGYYVPSPRDRQ
ncbi:MAG: hypothetical protein HY702_01370 [Gemmatimonadetes bacterium]|nr:hypothetical protein [Gemmatimonadota bacterium]